jgi:hypothetical protein
MMGVLLKEDIESVACVSDADILVHRGTLRDLFDFAINHKAIVVPEQFTNRCHCYEKIHSIFEEMEHYKVFRTCLRGVAGAGLTIRTSLFIELGMFATGSLYGGNEASLWNAAMSKNIPVYVDTKNYVTHPVENDLGYQEWKDKCQSELRSGRRGVRSGYYDMSL